ncbi:MAG: RodZ domain-containing protein [Candidatus Solibacter sp.]
MTPVGETLRRERLKRNLDLEEISRELKISARFLKAIEDDQYDKLPGGVFAKSFVRQYARLLGLDEEQIAGQVQQSIAPVPEFAQLPDREKPGGFAPISVPKVDEWQTVGDRRFHWSGWLSALGLVAVMLICSAVYTWMQHPKLALFGLGTPAQTTSAQPTPAPVVPAPAPVQTPPPPQPTTEQPASQPPSQVANATEPPAPAPETKPPEARKNEANLADPKPIPAPVVTRSIAPGDVTLRVTITAEEAVWVLARADGKYAFSATMDANSTRTVEASKDITLRLGNAGGVTISLNGKPIGPAGPKGQVRTLQFTSGGFQIVPAKPPSAAPEAAAVRL